MCLCKAPVNKFQNRSGEKALINHYNVNKAPDRYWQVFSGFGNHHAPRNERKYLMSSRGSKKPNRAVVPHSSIRNHAFDCLCEFHSSWPSGREATTEGRHSNCQADLRHSLSGILRFTFSFVTNWRHARNNKLMRNFEDLAEIFYLRSPSVNGQSQSKWWYKEEKLLGSISQKICHFGGFGNTTWFLPIVGHYSEVTLISGP